MCELALFLQKYKLQRHAHSMGSRLLSRMSTARCTVSCCNITSKSLSDACTSCAPSIQSPACRRRCASLLIMSTTFPLWCGFFRLLRMCRTALRPASSDACCPAADKFPLLHCCCYSGTIAYSTCSVSSIECERTSRGSFERCLSF